ncbi:MAG: hypothetical protein U0R24_07030 [Solirubrobacterales bacterium]
MEERVQRQILVHVDLQMPPCAHRKRRSLAGGERIDPLRVGRELRRAVAVSDQLRGPFGDRDEIGEPGRGESEGDVDGLGPRALLGALGRLGSLAADPVGIPTSPSSAARSSAASATAAPCCLPRSVAIASRSAHGLPRRRRPAPSAHSSATLRSRSPVGEPNINARPRSPPPRSARAATVSGDAPGSSEASRLLHGGGRERREGDPLAGSG